VNKQDKFDQKPPTTAEEIKQNITAACDALSLQSDQAVLA
jgi:hypothetical protein